MAQRQQFRGAGIKFKIQNLKKKVQKEEEKLPTESKDPLEKDIENLL